MEADTHESFDPQGGGEAPIPEPTEILAPPAGTPEPPHGFAAAMRRIFVGPQGLRAGWSVLIFASVFALLLSATFFVISHVHPIKHGPPPAPTAPEMIMGEGMQLLLILISAFVVALIERRRLLDFNLNGPRRPQHFLGGLAAGFGALSLLVGVMAAGGWLHFDGLALSGPAIAEDAFLWGVCFLFVGCVEEGIFRCYLQFTLTRGINFWWALGVVAALCADLAIRAKGNGVWGVYAMAILGLVLCGWLQIRRVPNSGFWYAAWVTSTLFGFVHTGNGGENPIGIFLAAFVGAIFCVSIRLTGSAWWAIGCHAGWDWAQTFFYGTPDSGLVVKGHLLSSSIHGKILLSGGADGPEGSVLAIGVLVLLLVYLLAVYGRRSDARPAPPAELAPQ